MTVLASGYGVGDHVIPTTPNMLRVVLGECREDEAPQEKLVMVETQIDDMNPEFYPNAMDRLFEAGAVERSHRGAELRLRCFEEGADSGREEGEIDIPFGARAGLPAALLAEHFFDV